MSVTTLTPEMAAGLCVMLKEECEKQHARAEAAEAKNQRLDAALRTGRMNIEASRRNYREGSNKLHDFWMQQWELIAETIVRSCEAALADPPSVRDREGVEMETCEYCDVERPFNELAPDQAELLALLLEELGEAQQAIGKILRHGYRSRNPDSPGSGDNADALERELGDVAAATMLLYGMGISELAVESAKERKLAKVRQYLHHAYVLPPSETGKE